MRTVSSMNLRCRMQRPNSNRWEFPIYVQSTPFHHLQFKFNWFDRGNDNEHGPKSKLIHFTSWNSCECSNNCFWINRMSIKCPPFPVWRFRYSATTHYYSGWFLCLRQFKLLLETGNNIPWVMFIKYSFVLQNTMCNILNGDVTRIPLKKTACKIKSCDPIQNWVKLHKSSLQHVK